MRSRMTPSVYRHSGGSGLRPKPAGFLVPPPPSRGVNTPTRSTGHHVRVNSRQHILQNIKLCSRSICFYIRVYFCCLHSANPPGVKTSPRSTCERGFVWPLVSCLRSYKSVSFLITWPTCHCQDCWGMLDLLTINMQLLSRIGAAYVRLVTSAV